MDDRFYDLRLRDFLLFDRVAARGTISAAARELGIPKPTASRRLQVLEEHLGQTLLQRTTRQASLTDRGQAFLTAVRSLLVGAEAVRLAGTGDEPGGTLRISVPVPLGRLVGGRVIAAFRQRLPGVRLEISLENHRSNLVRDRIDLAIRGGPLTDSQLVARRLARVALWLYAGPNLADLPAARIPVVAAPGDEVLLRRSRPDFAAPAVVVDDRSAVADAIVAGAGAGILPGFLGEPPRRRGELVRLGPKPLTTLDVHAVFLPTQRRDPRLRTLIDIIAEELTATLDEH
jgi:DNA-binding transcriptional LysR family regulator